MAELITTQEEKDAASYLDWDDAALGRAVKHNALMIADAIREHDSAGEKVLLMHGAMIVVMAEMRTMNAANLKLRLDNVKDISGNPIPAYRFHAWEDGHKEKFDDDPDDYNEDVYGEDI